MHISTAFTPLVLHQRGRRSRVQRARPGVGAARPEPGRPGRPAQPGHPGQDEEEAPHGQDGEGGERAGAGGERGQDYVNY